MPVLLSRIAASPWWVRVVLIFAASRVVTTVILLAFAAVQDANSFTPAHPDYLQLVTMWDGVWYRQIAEYGYPATLPHDDVGNLTENAWAFLPGYPGVLRGLELVTGAPYALLAAIVSIGCALGAALVFHRLLVQRLGDAAATWSVALFCFAPLSPILQVGYAESAQLFLVAVILLFVQRRRYLISLPLIVIAGFTRPTGMALGLFLLVHLVQRWRARASEPLPARQVGAIVVAGLVSAAVGFAWPVIAWAVTGSPSAYTDTELVWRSAYIGHQDLLPFTAWFQGAEWWLGFAFRVPEPAALIGGIVIVLLLIAALVLVLLLPSTRRLGPELPAWSASWAVYLLAVFFPQSSTFRLLMPMFPLLGAVQPRSSAVRALLIALGVVGQIGWCAICWQVVGADWSPP
jgi:hypothetical protein